MGSEELAGPVAVRSYRDLVVWQKSMSLAEDCYRVTRSFPRDETYGMCSQIRRAVVSIPANIAEGQGRTSTKEFLHHLAIAYGSLCEAETQLLIGRQLEYLSQGDYSGITELTARVGRLINGLSNSLQNKL